MGSSISLLQWRKAFMLEFLNDKEVEEVFTFSVAPQSVEFDYPQRINETKTFGGSVFDDYGNDTYRITINGTTINEDKKFIYRGLKKPPLYLSGSKELAELQKVIKNWADGKVKQGFFRNNNKLKEGLNKRKIYLYDLSKMNVLQIATGTATKNYWRVFIKDLKTKQDKSNPKAMSYTLEMLAVEDSELMAKGFFASAADNIAALQNAMEAVNSVMEITEATTAAFNETAVLINKYSHALLRASARQIVTASLDTVTRILGVDSSSIYNCAANVLLGVQNFKAICNNSESGVDKKSTSEKIRVFNVLFDTNGGSYVKTQKIEYCKLVEKPDNPTKDYYSFDDWYSDSVLTAKYDFTQEVIKSITLYAKWILSTAKVTFNSRNGSSVAPQYVSVGDKAVVPVRPTRSGYAFDVWCTDLACTQEFDFENTVINDNITLYARWTQTCTITFNSNGGSDAENQTVSIGEKAVYPMTPTKENFTFAYWCIDSDLQNVFDFATEINSNITLYACWIQISNRVSFNSMGGSDIESQRIAIGEYAEEPTPPTKEGFIFVYWATDQAGTNQFRFRTTQITANITLYAKWTEKICTVSFDTDGGSEIEAQEVEYGRKAIFPQIPTKQGCSFEMWRTRHEVEVDSGKKDENDQPIMTTEYEYEEFNFNTDIKEDVTLYALWFGGEE